MPKLNIILWLERNAKATQISTPSLNPIWTTAATVATTLKKFKINEIRILKSLALAVDPKTCTSICSNNHINVTIGLETIPNIYKNKNIKFSQ